MQVVVQVLALTNGSDGVHTHSFVALQLAADPPFDPLQVQDHGPEPETDDGVPAEHRFEFGAVVKDCPLEEPQAPFAGGKHIAVYPNGSLDFAVHPPQLIE